MTQTIECKLNVNKYSIICNILQGFICIKKPLFIFKLGLTAWGFVIY